MQPKQDKKPSATYLNLAREYGILMGFGAFILLGALPLDRWTIAIAGGFCTLVSAFVTGATIAEKVALKEKQDEYASAQDAQKAGDPS